MSKPCMWGGNGHLKPEEKAQREMQILGSKESQGVGVPNLWRIISPLCLKLLNSIQPTDLRLVSYLRVMELVE